MKWLVKMLDRLCGIFRPAQPPVFPKRELESACFDALDMDGIVRLLATGTVEDRINRGEQLLHWLIPDDKVAELSERGIRVDTRITLVQGGTMLSVALVKDGGRMHCLTLHLVAREQSYKDAGGGWRPLESVEAMRKGIKRLDEHFK